MQFRNARYNQHGSIDMEVEHPTLGWLPFTANPDDPEQHGRELYDAAISTRDVASCSAPSPQALQAVIVAAVQARLDEFAQTRGYDGILSACTYANDAVPQFAAEGARAVELRGQTWATLYQMLVEVDAGTRPLPTSYEEIEDDLPPLEWT